MIKIGSFCSGIGAFEQALKELNIDHSIEVTCELDKFARETYQSNHDTKLMVRDITKINENKLPDFDLFTAGFPCQSFSLSGKRKGFEETRGTIFFDCLRILKEKRPKYFILENVKGLLSSDSGRSFDVIINSLSKSINGQYVFPMYNDCLNYHVYYKILNAKDYGIPQNRERVFIIGFRDDDHSFKFPNKQNLELRLKDLLESHVAEKYYLSDKLLETLLNHKKGHKEKGNGFGCNILSKTDSVTSTLSSRYFKDGSEILINTGLINKDVCKTVRSSGRGSIDKHSWDLGQDPNLQELTSNKSQGYRVYTDNLSVTLAGTAGGGGAKTGLYLVQDEDPKMLRTTRTEECKKIRSENLKKGKDYAPKGMKVLKERNDNLANTILANQDKEQYLKQYNRIRRLTPFECKRLMGFPDDFIMNCSDTQKYKQLGNSIVVNVLKEIFKCVF